MVSHLESNFTKPLNIRGSNTYLRSTKYHIVHSATKKRALLGMEAFWERPKLEPPNISTKKMWTIAPLKAKETTEIGMNNSRMHGSTNVRRLKRRKYCAVIDHGRFCDTKAVWLTYLSLCMEGGRIFGTQEPTIQVDQISTTDLWESLENVSSPSWEI